MSTSEDQEEGVHRAVLSTKEGLRYVDAGEERFPTLMCQWCAYQLVKIEIVNLGSFSDNQDSVRWLLTTSTKPSTDAVDTSASVDLVGYHLAALCYAFFDLR